MRPGETSVLGASDNGMQAVAEFVEQRFYILVCEQRRFVRSWRREIAKQRDGGPLVFAIGQEFAADNVELREVIEFSFAGTCRGKTCRAARHWRHRSPDKAGDQRSICRARRSFQISSQRCSDKC